MSLLNEVPKLPPPPDGSNPIAVRDPETGVSDYLFEYAVPNGAPYRCAATFVGDMGPIDAVLATERFRRRRTPKTVVLLGIVAEFLSVFFCSTRSEDLGY